MKCSRGIEKLMIPINNKFADLDSYILNSTVNPLEIQGPRYCPKLRMCHTPVFSDLPQHNSAAYRHY